MNILVVDDDGTNRKLLRVKLEEEGHRVFEAEDGVQALGMLAREPVEGIISDVLMPNMDGYLFCLEVRKSEQHKTIPIFIYPCSKAPAATSWPRPRQITSGKSSKRPAA